MTTERRQQHTHPVFWIVLVFCMTLVLAVQGLGLRYVVHTAKDAKETAEIAEAVTNPECDTKVKACRDANERRRQQGNPVPDIEEISVIAAFCGSVDDNGDHRPDNATYDEVKSCVDAAFKRITGRTRLSPATTTTTTR